MGVFAAFFGCIGVVGFNGCCSGVRSGDGGFMLVYISGCRGVIGCKVAMGGALCAKKFALRAHNTPNSAFLRLLGEFFRGNATVGVVLGELFRANRYGVQVLDAMRCTSGWLRWGFCAMRSPLAACRRRVGALDGVIPPDWWR